VLTRLNTAVLRQWHADALLDVVHIQMEATCREGRCAWKLGVKGLGSSPAEVGPECRRDSLLPLSPGVSGERHLLVKSWRSVRRPHACLLNGQQLTNL
jgi:hypothetical protein